MTTGATGQLGLALPVQGELSGTWGDTVNNGITEYTNIAIAGTLTLTNDGAVTLANTTGDASASNITSSLTGAGTVTAQFAIVKVTGTLTTAKVITGPSYSKTYVVDNTTATYAVTFKASGQTGVSIVAGEKATVYYNGTDYVKVASSTADGVTTFSAGTTGFTPSTATSGAVTLAGTLATTNGGTGLTSFTSGGVVYASSTSALATGSALVFNGTNLGLGVTPSAWATYKALQVDNGAIANYSPTQDASYLSNAYYNAGWKYIASAYALRYAQDGAGGAHKWYTSASGTAGNAITFTQAMTLDASGNLGVGTSSPKIQEWRTGTYLTVANASTRGQVEIDSAVADSGSASLGALIFTYSTNTTNHKDVALIEAISSGATANQRGGALNFYTKANGTASPALNMTLDSAGYLSGVWADKVTALGNTGTATTITCTSGNVFTATLTGNCTFTLSAPSTTTANTATSFTLILTNDGTAGRTVAWSGGTFLWPGGAASLSRTTTANATDIWFFFSPNGGTTWYGNIAQKNLTA